MAVLVAIAIPIFNSQLEKSRDSTSIANMRSAYAEAQTLALTATKDGETAGNATYNAGSKEGTFTVVVDDVIIKSNDANSWSGQGTDMAFTVPADAGKTGKADMTFSYVGGELNSVTMTDPS